MKMMAPNFSVFLRKLGYRNISYLSKTLFNVGPFTKIYRPILLTEPQRVFVVSKFSEDAYSKEADNLTDIILKSKSKEEYLEDKKKVLKVVKFLLSHGCSVDDIKNKCSAIDPNYSSYLKVRLLSEMNIDMSLLLPLMSVNVGSLRRVVKKFKEDKSEIKNFPNRIDYLSHHLEATPEQLVPHLSKHTSLLTLPFSKLEIKMNLLKNANVSAEYILKDLWIFNYRENLLQLRIAAAAAAGVQIKPWMLRCSQTTFDSLLEKFDSTKEILGDDDQFTYLGKKLECSTDYVKYIMEKNKLLQSINIPKLDKLFDFLYEKGYTPQELRLFPRIFCSSVQSLEVRFNEAKLLRETLPTISQLCLSSKRFKENLEKKNSAQTESTSLETDASKS